MGRMYVDQHFHTDSWWCVPEGRLFSLSSDIELAVARVETRARNE